MQLHYFLMHKAIVLSVKTDFTDLLPSDICYYDHKVNINFVNIHVQRISFTVLPC